MLENCKRGFKKERVYICKRDCECDWEQMMDLIAYEDRERRKKEVGIDLCQLLLVYYIYVTVLSFNLKIFCPSHRGIMGMVGNYYILDVKR